MERDTDCVFCKIVTGELPCFKLFEDDETLAFMDINPLHDGHALVISKGHYRDLLETPDRALADVMSAARRVAAAVKETLAPDGINIVQANGPGAAQSVFHFHVHVLPRRSGDEARINWEIKPGNMDRIKELAARLRSSIGA